METEKIIEQLNFYIKNEEKNILPKKHLELSGPRSHMLLLYFESSSGVKEIDENLKSYTGD